MVYSLSELTKEYEKGKKYKFLFFWGHNPPKDGSINQSCLSQWWLCNFKINGVQYSCAEQYMMAEKARIFKDEEMLENIMNSDSPAKMKAFGREVKNFDKDVWSEHCYEIVKKASKEKFSQNAELLHFLFGTKDSILVEASPRDRIWGIGMGQNNPDAENPTKWRGQNLLGFALTEAREGLLKSIKL